MAILMCLLYLCYLRSPSKVKILQDGIGAYRELARARTDDFRDDCWWTRAAAQWEKRHGRKF